VRHAARRAKARDGDPGGRVAPHLRAARAGARIARVAARRVRPMFEAKLDFSVRGLH
jgi:DNA invertase Pin-like site-specific DNA recombinase